MDNENVVFIDSKEIITVYKDKNQVKDVKLHKEVTTMQYALQSLGFYAEVADYVAVESINHKPVNREPYTTEHAAHVLLTNANQKEFLTLWYDEYIYKDEELYQDKYHPVDYYIYDRCMSWCNLPHIYMGNEPNNINCGFPGNSIHALINQPVKYYNDMVIGFYSKGDYPEFSNFYLADMRIETYEDEEIVDVKTCASVEHYFQTMKALEFDPDGETLKQMGNHLSCSQIKSLGRKVQNFDAEVWNIRRRFHMRNALRVKFYQNKELQKLLLGTGDAILAEASPRDTFWGIGYSKSNPKAYDPTQWRGKNVLGNMLMYLREEIRADN